MEFHWRSPLRPRSFARGPTGEERPCFHSCTLVIPSLYCGKHTLCLHPPVHGHLGLVPVFGSLPGFSSQLWALISGWHLLELSWPPGHCRSMVNTLGFSPAAPGLSWGSDSQPIPSIFVFGVPATVPWSACSCLTGSDTLLTLTKVLLYFPVSRVHLCSVFWFMGNMTGNSSPVSVTVLFLTPTLCLGSLNWIQQAYWFWGHKLHFYSLLKNDQLASFNNFPGQKI